MKIKHIHSKASGFLNRLIKALIRHSHRRFVYTVHITECTHRKTFINVWSYEFQREKVTLAIFEIWKFSILYVTAFGQVVNDITYIYMYAHKRQQPSIQSYFKHHVSHFVHVPLHYDNKNFNMLITCHAPCQFFIRPLLKMK